MNFFRFLLVSWFAFLLVYGIYLNFIKERKRNEIPWWMRPSSFLVAFADAPGLWTVWVTIILAIVYNVAAYYLK